jgi:hypothetical protein
MVFRDKDLDALLWDWAADILKAHDSGYPSSYELKQRVDSGIVFVPDYFPSPKVCALGNAIYNLRTELKNIIAYKYLYNMKIPEIAQENDCTPRTIHRKMNEARSLLLEEMSVFVYKSTRM